MDTEKQILDLQAQIDQLRTEMDRLHGAIATLSNAAMPIKVHNRSLHMDKVVSVSERFNSENEYEVKVTTVNPDYTAKLMGDFGSAFMELYNRRYGFTDNGPRHRR